ncbi:MAG: hypothetical protein V1843_03560 [bacterium]
MRIALVILLLGLLIHPCYGIHPLYTEEALVLDRGGYSIEPSIEYCENPNTDTKTTSFYTSLSYGLWDNSELTFQIPYISIVSQGSAITGFGDGYITSKNILYPNLGLVVNLKLANADPANGLGTGATAISFIGAYDLYFENTMLSANLGYNLIDGSENKYIGSTAIVHPINPLFNIYGELYGESTLKGTDTTYGLIAANWALEDIIFDIGIRRSFTDSLNTIVYGMTYEYDPQ